ncbi:phage portal protein [Candidatus Pacearchaeota archaeon]|jgi:hypothetical protein|nr:phage portal protein [Candidatus Pacearchaeota archaeon]
MTEVLTDLAWLEKGKEFPPKCEAERIAAYHENRELRENEFSEIWKDYQRLMREDSKTEFKIILGYFKLSTKKTLDTLLGKQPLIGQSAPKDADAKIISDLIEYTDLYQADYEVAYDLDSLGDGFFKIYRDADGKSVIQSNDPSNVYVVVEPGNLRKVRYYVIASKFEKKIGEEEKHYLKVEIHGRNEQKKHVIEHRVYELGSLLGKCQIGEQVQDLGQFVDEIPALAANPSGIEENPVDDFLVIHVPGPRTSCDVYGESSYGEDLKSLWRAIVRRYTGIDSVLTKHEDPNLIAPIGYTTKDPVTQKQTFVGGGRVFQYRHDPGMQAPDIKYLVWDGNLIPSETSIERLQSDFWNAAEVPESCLAGKADGGVASGVAYRLMMTPLITKANRLEMSLRPRLQKALRLALLLQGTPIEDITVKFSDSLPRIPLEEAQRIATLGQMPQFQGEIGGAWLLRQLEIPEDQAKAIMEDPTRNQGGGF